MKRLLCLALVVGCTADGQHDGMAVAIARDQRGAPRLISARDLAPAPAATALESARTHVSRLATIWGVAPGKLPALDGVGEVPVRGGTVARIAQVIDGLPVWGGELRVLVRPGGVLHAASGTLHALDTPRTPRWF